MSNIKPYNTTYYHSICSTREYQSNVAKTYYRQVIVHLEDFLGISDWYNMQVQPHAIGNQVAITLTSMHDRLYQVGKEELKSRHAYMKDQVAIA